MQRVKVRFGGLLYDLTLPPGGRIERHAGGLAAVVIPGPHPDDTSTVLSPRAALLAARDGRHGLRLGGPVALIGA